MARGAKPAAPPTPFTRHDIEIFIAWLEEIQEATHILNDIRFSQIYYSDTKSDGYKRDVVREGLQLVIGNRSALIAADLRKALRPTEKKPQLEPVDGGRA